MPRGKTAFLMPTRNDCLCSAHFEDSRFQRDLNSEYIAAGVLEAGYIKSAKKLVPGAVPKIFAHRAPPPSVEP